MKTSIKCGPRVVALVGPYLSGKTTLLENILFKTQVTRRRSNGSRVFADPSPESAEMNMGTELNMASAEFLGDEYIFLDCPGSVELAQESRNILHIADIAVVVCEPDLDKIMSLSPLLHELEGLGIPHILFLNKIDRAHTRIRDVVEAVEKVSALPVVMRHVPIRQDQKIMGFVDLAAQRAYEYRTTGNAFIVDMPDSLQDQIADDRFHMLETVAHFHDELMDELLMDIDPSAEEVFTDLSQDLQQGKLMPVMMGAGQQGFGIHRLLKALRHEMPSIEHTLERLCVEAGEDMAFVFKTRHLPHQGKMTFARVFSGVVTDGDDFAGHRIMGLNRIVGAKMVKAGRAKPGAIACMSKLPDVMTGDTLGEENIDKPLTLVPVFGMAISVENQSDDAKLSDALSQIIEDDPSYSLEHREETGELILWGQGEMHMRLAKVKLKGKYNLKVTMTSPAVLYQETIKQSKEQHSRYKKQSGGHGQFGDVVIEINPMPSGAGFQFDENIKGGAIPKQYIQSVEAGVKEYLTHGPLGYPVVDVRVTLRDGSHHAVDSSDMAFKMAGRLAMSQAVPDCSPVLLEPIEKVSVKTPSNFTTKINSLISARRGQILSFDARAGWPGWDEVNAHMPSSELQDLIIELRSVTQGSGTFAHEFDHMSEIDGAHKKQALRGHRESKH